ncbi:LysM peptidoglycan-binding domain-containing protein [uncultured Thiohalocapsa sp.]|uniref:LysM peptidoglycan-binding domain-containing protein n=1 Tax=uncultured Thiohalocapsa sp. TaxID=768990 RepID=UPI0025CFABA9|nr:LysM domain-containing protein [uncultured Thiohalocapsa sp.]
MPSQHIARRRRTPPHFGLRRLRPVPPAKRVTSAPALLSLLLVATPSAALAQRALRMDAPERYVVQPGDTLWQIAERFLDAPWRWPQVWQANPDIADPNRIYPGDVLVADRSGASPRIRKANGGDGLRTVKLSPRVRVRDLDREIPAIPIHAIAPFLSRPLITTAQALEGSPYVVGFAADKLMGGPGDSLLVRGISTADSVRWEILRPGRAYRDPATGEPLGFGATAVASAELQRPGDPATLVVTDARQEIKPGDRARPARAEAPVHSFFPHPAKAGVRGRIIAALRGVSHIGQYDVIALNLGRRDGVEAGTVLATYRGGELRRDDVRSASARQHPGNQPPAEATHRHGAWQPDGHERERSEPNTPPPRQRGAASREPQYRVPDSHTGTIMVFRAFEKMSFALVMRARQAIHLDEMVAPPRPR